MCPEPRDRGSATVWLVGLLSLIGLATVVGVLHGGAAVARHRAESAADFAALAGAVRASLGHPDGCGVAATIASANGSRLVHCVVDGDDVEVEVTTPLRLWRLGGRVAVARARAGPAAGSPAHTTGGSGAEVQTPAHRELASALRRG